MSLILKITFILSQILFIERPLAAQIYSITTEPLLLGIHNKLGKLLLNHLKCTHKPRRRCIFTPKDEYQINLEPEKTQSTLPSAKNPTHPGKGSERLYMVYPIKTWV